MTLPLMHIPTPQVLGSNDCRTTLYWPESDSEVPVIVGFDIDGYKDICIQSVHVDYGRNSCGPDIQETLDEMQIADLEHAVCLQLPWDRKPDERDEPGYAPAPWLV